MTTATINFDQPTLFKEGRFTRDNPSAPGPDRTPTPPQPRAPAPTTNRSPAPPAEPAATPAHAHDERGGLTLDDVLSAAWEGLAAHSSVTCPVCSGSMAPRYGSGPQPVGGRCRRCGSTLG
jgi:hypothetical protein